MGTCKWLEMTPRAVKELLEETDVAVVPIGSIESHGPHMPSGADGFKAEHIASEAARLEKAVVFPCIFLNVNSPGKALPGVEFEADEPFISFPPSLVCSMLKQVCLEVARVGFRKVLCLSGHGPTRVVVNSLQFEIQEQARSLEKSGRPVPLVFLAHVMTLAGEAVRELGISTSGHGGADEVSLTAACVPDLVDLEKAAGLEPCPAPQKKIKGLDYLHNWPKTAPRGYQGSPSEASIEAGRKILDSTVKKLAGLIRELKEYDAAGDI